MNTTYKSYRGLSLPAVKRRGFPPVSVSISSNSSPTNLAAIFNPDAKGFSAANMAYLAYCAQAIYKPDSESLSRDRYSNT